MLGSIIGDIIGSRFESSPRYPAEPVKDKKFELFTDECKFTDDTVLTCATAEAIINRKTFLNTDNPQFGKYYRKWGLKYHNRGYGGGFRKWLAESKLTVSNSYANGVMMRCSPIALFYSRHPLEYALDKAAKSTLLTHNSPESVRGVQSIVSAIHMAINRKSKLEIRNFVEEQFGHMLNITVEDARLIPKTSIRCNITAPQALVAFMESTDYESAIRNAVYIGGDTDTNAAIAGAIAEAFYGMESIPLEFITKSREFLTDEIRDIICTFYELIEFN